MPAPPLEEAQAKPPLPQLDIKVLYSEGFHKRFRPTTFEELRPFKDHLTVKIREWLASSKDHYMFGKDVPNSPENADGSRDFRWAWHVHMVPEYDTNPVKLANWDMRWTAGDESKLRVSNRMLIYSLHAKQPATYGLYVLDLVGDKVDGHAVFKNQALLEDFETLARKHQTLGQTPRASE